jgi:hypothetical protein
MNVRKLPAHLFRPALDSLIRNPSFIIQIHNSAFQIEPRSIPTLFLHPHSEFITFRILHSHIPRFHAESNEETITLWFLSGRQVRTRSR